MRSGLYIIVLPVLLTAGCSLTPSFRHGRVPSLTIPSMSSSGGTYGRMPDIPSSLAVLTTGASDKGDVLRVLGAPKGYGMARLTGNSGPQVVWHYEYLETHGTVFAIKDLMLFFDKEVFAGYLWFSAMQEMDKR